MEKRVKFDFELFFTNGGSLRGEDFRLDISGNDIGDRELADYIVDDLRLLMVGKVNILNKEILTEPHKRTPIDAAVRETGLIDLSHTIGEGILTYKGLPAPLVCDYLSRADSADLYEPGTEFQISKIEMVSNTGTYVDCPFHRYADGEDLADTVLERFAELDAVVISVPYTQTLTIQPEHLENHEIRNRAVLIHTGWSDKWNTEAYFEGHPYLTAGAAAYLKDCGVKLVGIDSHNIDDTSGNSRPVHSILLGARILIAEHLCNLQALPRDGFTFSAVPPKFKGVGTFPVRAYARMKPVSGSQTEPAAR
ncbi:cyclase [Pedobacter yulinensis]|uniref:Cyclase n=1 Tax=Pedobacter yulinensis TaxID=2126353 RepID=A0A2T3HNA9_9SPHI|nr:cyclase family protein [Pedobacter yulinensis]PST83871.1 cyclase [Pedobacter yulinensis]